MKSAKIAAAMLPFLFFPALSKATEVYVVEAKGVDLAQGQSLDGAKPLTLAVGQRVTLITSDGRTIKLKGPSNEPPAPETEKTDANVVDSLKGLLKTREANTSSAGAIRQGTVSFEQPAPWLVEVVHGGDRCLKSGERTVLWKEEIAEKGGDIDIAPADKSWSAHAAWPSGNDRLALPATLTLQDGQAYMIGLDGGSVPVRIHVIPANIKTPSAQVAWMVEMGCDPQARSLINSLN